MRRATIASILILALSAALAATFGAALRPAATIPASNSVRFLAVDVFIDSGSTPLAAWQLEIRLGNGESSAKLAGVEGGETGSVFAAPPSYDPAALMNDRIIIAAFSLEDAAKLPTGRTRIARLHVQLPAGSPADAEAVAKFTAVIQAAASTTDNKIDTAAASLAPAVQNEERSGGDQ